MNEFNSLKLKHNNAEEELQSIKLRLLQIEEEKQQLLQRQEALNMLSTHNRPEANQLDTDQKIHLFQELFNLEKSVEHYKPVLNRFF